MARSLDERQQAELTAFVNALATLAGYTTTAEWARDSGYPAPNLTNLRNGKGAIDGYNLLRLMRAAAAKVGQDAEALGLALAAGTTLPTEQILDRLALVEDGLTDLTKEVQRLARPAASATQQVRVGTPRVRRPKGDAR